MLHHSQFCKLYLNALQDVRDKQMTLVFSSYRLVEKQEKEICPFFSNTQQKLLTLILFWNQSWWTMFMFRPLKQGKTLAKKINIKSVFIELMKQKQQNTIHLV